MGTTKVKFLLISGTESRMFQKSRLLLARANGEFIF
jgi:hypothetical protein